jgi:cell division protein FtsL
MRKLKRSCGKVREKKPVMREAPKEPAESFPRRGQAGRLVKITLFVSVVCLLLFCVTWQNVHLRLLQERVEGRVQVRNELENDLYQKKLQLRELESRERIREIAVNDLGMVPITYRDVKVIIY